MGDKQFSIGRKSEHRVKRVLTELGFVVHDSKRPYPDFYISHYSNDYMFAIECKSIHSLHSTGRAGKAKLTLSEITETSKMRSLGYVPMLLVELRDPKGRAQAYIMIDWSQVESKWRERRPNVLNFTFWDSIRAGIPLDTWLKMTCRTSNNQEENKMSEDKSSEGVNCVEENR